MRNKIIGCCGAILMALAFAFSFAPSAEVAAKDIPIDVTTHGYGKYVVTVRGEGLQGVWDADSVTFYYYPVYGEVVQENDKTYVDLQYDPDDGSPDPSTTGEVASIAVRVYDENGNEVGFSPITVTPPTTRIELPFEEYGLGSGTYTVKIFAYDRNGGQLGDPYIFTITYDDGKEVIPVPDTGGLMQNMNISQQDYLITGLIIFGIVAVAGTVFIVRNDKKKR